MSTWTRGDRLTYEGRKDALRRYVHRHTRDHKCSLTPFQDITDDEWLRQHAFPIRSDGRIDERHNHCMPHYWRIDR